MNTLLFILVTYGFSNIVVYGSIFKGMRNFLKKVSPNFWGELVSCMICFPTWVGFFLSLFFFSPTEYYGLGGVVIPSIFTSVFFDGILASGTVWLIHTFQEMCERAFN
tara:strand:+ start:788 stop:1111 length:324 start_codon:yes stop_codon:yes gene_type:complete